VSKEPAVVFVYEGTRRGAREAGGGAVVDGGGGSPLFLLHSQLRSVGSFQGADSTMSASSPPSSWDLGGGAVEGR
jgi:hypothetical protein